MRTPSRLPGWELQEGQQLPRIPQPEPIRTGGGYGSSILLAWLGFAILAVAFMALT